MKVVIVLYHRFQLWNAPDWFAPRLKKDFPQLNVIHLRKYEGIEEALGDAEVAIAWSIRPQQLSAAHKLRWIHSPAAAVHQLLFPELIESDVTLTNAREVHGPVVAEHVIAQIFALAKKLPQAVRLQKKKIWGQESLWRDQPSPREVMGSTLGLVGLGSIGREVAKRAAALSMRVIAVREHPEKGTAPGVEHVYRSDQIDQLLQQSDYVVLAAPITALTASLMNAERLACMKTGSSLINVSRGSLVDESALVAALKRGRLASAALDVFSKEPLEAESPFWEMENVLVTPHSAAITGKLWERHYALISENMRRYLADKPLLSVVDKRAGY